MLLSGVMTVLWIKILSLHTKQSGGSSVSTRETREGDKHEGAL
jgi:hypothetical protein